MNTINLHGKELTLKEYASLYEALQWIGLGTPPVIDSYKRFTFCDVKVNYNDCFNFNLGNLKKGPVDELFYKFVNDEIEFYGFEADGQYKSTSLSL